jgi:hypothetical protein
MTIAEMVLEKLRQLPPDQQKVVLDFVESLKETSVRQSPAAKQAASSQAKPQASIPSPTSPNDVGGAEMLEETNKRLSQGPEAFSPADPRNPLRSLEGLWEGFGIEITDKDIAEARREMWSNFPREIS